MNEETAVINLATPIEIVVQPEVKNTISSISIDRVVERYNEKKVVAFLNNYPGELILWSGDTYNKDTNYTQEEIEARIVEILSSK